MHDDVTYSMEMFEVLEACIAVDKMAGRSYEEALNVAINTAFARHKYMDEETRIYDTSNILATFNIIWGE